MLTEFFMPGETVWVLSQDQIWKGEILETHLRKCADAVYVIETDTHLAVKIPAVRVARTREALNEKLKQL